jgi:hypothetical protein
MSTSSGAPNGLLAHNVFFTLRDRSEAARTRLVQACRTLLAGHAGIVFFACGVLADALCRDVNDRDFDVGLHIVFSDQAAHDAYQTAPDHQRFVAENQADWQRVRVFDSVVARCPATAF